MKTFLALLLIFQGTYLLSQPVITLKGQDTIIISVHDTFINPGANAWDSIDGDLSDSILYLPDVDTGVTGLYVDQYYVSNSRGQTAYKTRTIIVANELKPPVLILTGPDTMYIQASRNNSPYQDSGGYVPGMPGGLQSTVVITHNVNSRQAGIYKVMLMVQDVAGNTTVKYRTVIVRDSKAPVWNTQSHIIYLDAGFPFTDKLQAIDAYDNSIDVQVSYTSPVNPYILGTYQYIYTAHDSSGNNADTLFMTYIVRDKISPDLKIKDENPLMIQFYCTNSPYADAGASAYDALNGDVSPSITISGTVNTLILGTYKINYSVTDFSGNISKAIRTVIVQDKKAPQFMSNDTVRIGLDQAYTVYPPKVHDDSCDNKKAETFLYSTNVNPNLAGFYVEVWRLKDSSGNVAYQDRIVQVINLVSIKEKIFPELTIYPCPAGNTLNIQVLTNESDLVTVNVYDGNGQLVLQQSYLPVNDKGSIDLSGITPGLYLIDIQTGGKIYRKKINRE